MCARARLAESGFNRDSRINIKVKEQHGFHGSVFHGHDFYELDIVLSGNAKSRLNGREYDASRGMVFFLTPADFHDFTLGEGFDLLNVHFAADTVSAMILERLVGQKKRAFIPDEKHFDKIVRLTSVMSSLEDDSFGQDAILSRLLECILLLLASSEGLDEAETEGGRGNQLMQKAIAYVHEHFKENPSLCEVAAVAAVSDRYFCSKFREYTGKTYKEYLKELKLRYARRLLLVTEMSATEISEAAGYATQSHFNREFKDYFGTSPLKMRSAGR